MGILGEIGKRGKYEIMLAKWKISWDKIYNIFTKNFNFIDKFNYLFDNPSGKLCADGYIEANLSDKLNIKMIFLSHDIFQVKYTKINGKNKYITYVSIYNPYMLEVDFLPIIDAAVYIDRETYNNEIFMGCETQKSFSIKLIEELVLDLQKQLSLATEKYVKELQEDGIDIDLFKSINFY